MSQPATLYSPVDDAPAQPSLPQTAGTIAPKDLHPMEFNFKGRRESVGSVHSDSTSLTPGHAVRYTLESPRTIELIYTQPRTTFMYPSDMYILEAPPPLLPHPSTTSMLPPPPIDGAPFGFGGQCLAEMGPNGSFPPPQPVFPNPVPMVFPHNLQPPPEPFSAFHDGALPPPGGWVPGGTLSGALDMHTGTFYMSHEHPRLRTPQACGHCRARKAKCSGDRPVCQRCMSRGLICEYTSDKKSRTGVKNRSKRGVGEDGDRSPTSPKRRKTEVLPTTKPTAVEGDGRCLSIVSAYTDDEESRCSVVSAMESVISDSPDQQPATSIISEALVSSHTPPGSFIAITTDSPLRHSPTQVLTAGVRRRPDLHLDLTGISGDGRRAVEMVQPKPVFVNPWSDIHERVSALTSPIFSPTTRERQPSLAWSSGTGSSEGAASPLSLSPASAPPVFFTGFGPQPGFYHQFPPSPMVMTQGAPEMMPPSPMECDTDTGSSEGHLIPSPVDMRYTTLEELSFPGPSPDYVFPDMGAECTPRQEWPQEKQQQRSPLVSMASDDTMVDYVLA